MLPKAIFCAIPTVILAGTTAASGRWLQTEDRLGPRSAKAVTQFRYR